MKPKSKTGRRVNKNQYEQDYRAAREKATTDRHREVRRRHPAIERKLNEIVRHHGARKVLYRGLMKVRSQQIMTCFAVNLKRMSQLLGGKSLCIAS